MLERVASEDRGAVATEFAVVFPVLLLLLAGLLGIASQTVGRARLDRAVAIGTLAYLEAAQAAGGSDLLPGALPVAANGHRLCARLTDEDGAYLEAVPGCGAPNPGPSGLSASSGEAILTVWT